MASLMPRNHQGIIESVDTNAHIHAKKSADCPFVFYFFICFFSVFFIEHVTTRGREEKSFCVCVFLSPNRCVKAFLY